MRCKNAGSDYDENNIQWTCTASLPEEFKLGSTDVICEGYDYPEDPYILKGSCGVEYRLILTDKGHERYGKGRGGGGWSSDDDENTSKTFGANVAQALFWLVFIGILVYIVYSAFIARTQGPTDGAMVPGNRPGWGGGGGGGGWGGGDDHDDPPPPYYDTRPGYSKQGYGSAPGTQGWRPGFWSGALGGAAATWAADRMRNNRGNQTGGSTWGNRSGGSTWGGGGGGYDNGEGSSRSSSGSSFSSSTRHESTGFGSTSRR
jgi:hypothetical protein